MRSAFEDAATPYIPYSETPDPYDCSLQKSDGLLDIMLFFDVRQLAGALGDVSDGDALFIDFSAQLYDGSVLVGKDAILIKKPGKFRHRTNRRP